MIRVLHSVSNMARAGIETMLMNYYRKMVDGCGAFCANASRMHFQLCHP